MRAAIPDAVSVFLLPPSYGDLEKRLRGRGAGRRGDDPPAPGARAEEISVYREFDYVVVNDQLDACVATREVRDRGGALPDQPDRPRCPAHSGDVPFDEGDIAMVSNLIMPREIDSKFRFITVASQRAKQIQNGAKPRVESRSRKATRVAMQEVLAGAISWEVKDEIPKAPPAEA